MDKNKEYTYYAVGEKYDRVMPGDGAIFELTEDGGFINIGFTGMTEKERKTIHEGNLDICLSVIEGLVFVTANFNDEIIFDMPFNAGLYPEFEIKEPIDSGYFVPIIAVENSNNVIMAIRAVGFDIDFSRKLYECAKSQWDNKIENFDERLQSIYARYNPKDIIKFAIMKNKVRDTI